MSTFINTDPGRQNVIRAAHFALEATCQLYQWVNESSQLFKANGCTILFEHNSSYYSFSNAHVLADAQLGKTFFLLKDGTAMNVGGQLFYSLPVSSAIRGDDYLDVAIVKLNTNIAEHLINNGHKFLNISHIRSIPALSKGDVLLISGYPASKTKIDLKAKRLKFNPLILRTVPYLRKLNSETFSKGVHHVVEYPIKSLKETSTGQRMRGPKPHGLSGSGLWLFPTNNDPDSRPLLIGILSEYHENNAMLISNKIDIFIDLVRQKFDASIQNDGIKLELEYPGENKVF